MLESGLMPASCTVASATRHFAARLRGAGVQEVAGDVRRLVAGALRLSGSDVLRAPERVLTAAELQLLQAYVERRRKREPVSRILGERDFHGRTFAISPATLDPRPDSETVVTAALEIVRGEGWGSVPLRLLDVGTGSGCLLLSLLCELPHATGLGTDISAAALDTASLNGRRLGLERRVAWQCADGLERVAGPFHILVANPPYVRTAEIAGLEPEVRNFDPIEALDGGPDGLAVYRRLAQGSAGIVPNGWIVVEVGHDQAEEVAQLLSAAPGIDGNRIRIRCDVAGRPRCVAAKTLG
jgi:release factor glutamine methyltransferase